MQEDHSIQTSQIQYNSTVEDQIMEPVEQYHIYGTSEMEKHQLMQTHYITSQEHQMENHSL